jgi:hypothetical protein
MAVEAAGCHGGAPVPIEQVNMLLHIANKVHVHQCLCNAQVQRTADQSPFGAAVLAAPTGMEGVQAHQNSGFQMASFGVGNSFGGR